MYFCPISFLHWSFPLLQEGLFAGALVAGPALISNPDELMDELQMKYGGALPDSKSFREELENVPVLTKERAEALSKMLEIAAHSLSAEDPEEESPQRELKDQQDQINESIRNMKQTDPAAIKASQYPIEKERDLLHLIQIGDSQNARQVLNEILGTIFFSSGGNFSIVKTRIQELLVLLSRAAVEGGADAEQIFGMNFIYLKEVNQYKTIEEIAGWLTKVIDRFADLVFDLRDVKHADVIYKAVQYINQHFAEKITLDEVANKVYLSPAYFSKIFKDEMKCNFNIYLNQIRIEKSKNLLLNSQFSLVEIAGMTGYEDQSYFTKVFKKVAGLSPGKFRDKRGQVHSGIQKESPES